jgi:AraC-like DNA-binding protein
VSGDPTLSHAFHKTFERPFDTRWRSFDAHYLLYASAGAFNLEAEDRQWLLPPHRAALVRAGTAVRIWSSGPATSSSVLFSDRDFERPPAGARVFAMSDLAREMTGHAMRWDGGRQGHDRTADVFFPALAAVVAELACTPTDTWMPRAVSEALRRAADYTLATLDQDVGLQEVASAAILSPRTLARRFSAELHMTWRDYRRRARMIKAADLLSSTGEPVTEVGLAAGFLSTSSFIHAFRAFSGMAPTEYRKACAAVPAGGAPAQAAVPAQPRRGGSRDRPRASSSAR